MITYAIIGTNWISEEFFAAAQQGTPLQLSGICSRSEETGRAFAEKIGQPQVTVYPSAEALAAARDIDAVYIASPNSLHAAQSEVLLQAGKHVLCEKPIVTHPAQLERLQALAARQGLIYMEAIMYLHTPARAAVRETLPQLGSITGVQIDFSQRSSRYDALAQGELPNVFDPAMGGGALNDLGVYCIYPVLDFFGPPQAVQAYAHKLPSGADGSGGALLHYDRFTAALTWSKTGQSRGVSQIIGTQGTLTIRSVSQFQGITHYDNQGNPRTLALPLAKHEVMRYEAQAFCDYIQGKERAVSCEASGALAGCVAACMEEIRGKT